MDEETTVQAYRLAAFIASKHFEPATRKKPYYHMGATITDAVLQSGLNYKNVVYPRVQRLLRKYPSFKTTCSFLVLLQTVPPERLIGIRNDRKLELIQELSWFLYENGVETENDLVKWLYTEDNRHCLMCLNGIGPKTLDYLRMLSGYQAIAIDRHLFSFLKLAGIKADTYHEANRLYCMAAEFLHVGKCDLDQQVWEYM